LGHPTYYAATTKASKFKFVTYLGLREQRVKSSSEEKIEWVKPRGVPPNF